jgi:DNA-directed RNA polymerase II subunit RPB1
MLYKEIKKVLEFDGTYINDRHFITLADIMTSKGALMSITRHGINRGDNGPLMKCSFEETIDVLTDSAVFAETDMLRGVTENITVGKLANVGTGSFDIYYNETSECSEYRPLSSCSEEYYEESYLSDEYEESEI